jgi:hypothetical protein
MNFERAADILRHLPRRHHEGLDEKLTGPIEQLSQRPLAFRSVENILLVDLHPRQRSTLAANWSAQMCQFLLSFEQILARNQPLGAGDNFMPRKRIGFF